MDRISNGMLWLAALAASLAAIATIVWTWTAVEREYLDRAERIGSVEDLSQFVTRMTEGGLDQAIVDPVVVPTGVFVQSVGFASASDVNLTGYIWQKYPPDYPFDQGVMLPEQVSSGDTMLEESYRENILEDGRRYELVGWYFDVTVRQSFDYSHYPLDILTIWLRIWPEEFADDHRVLLVPDFRSYFTPHARRFGLDQDLVQGEWEIDETFWSYHDVPYDTRFGFDDLSAREAGVDVFQELYFNLGAKRKFINAFVINLVPLFVVALLLFSAVMTISDDDEQSDRFGFNTSGILATCSALFFVVLLSHIQVRSQFAGSGLVYIEYFYLTMYVVIFLTAMNGYLFTLRPLRGRTILHVRDNIVAKVLFWPLLLWAMAIISLIVL